MIYQCYKHKGDFMEEKCCCTPVEQKSRIIGLYGKMNVLGNEVLQTRMAVTKKLGEYYGITSEKKEVEARQSGVVNEIDWMIDDIRKMVADIREYVETL